MDIWIPSPDRLPDMDPQSRSSSGYGPPPSFVELDPPTKIGENIILNVLVEIDNTFPLGLVLGLDVGLGIGIRVRVRVNF